MNRDSVIRRFGDSARVGLGAAGVSWAATLRVQPGQDLAAAVQAAAPGDVVEVARGMYRANLLIDKPLTLRGIDRPTISGGNQNENADQTTNRVDVWAKRCHDSEFATTQFGGRRTPDDETSCLCMSSTS